MCHLGAPILSLASGVALCAVNMFAAHLLTAGHVSCARPSDSPSLLLASPPSSFPTSKLSRKCDRAVPSELPFPSPGFRNFLSLLPKN
ncbi:hypothetical protein HOY80DRAFT_672009 [Tuber brumale]|nr:hypothetical protein HOY80DRAFT_672009 [Tuber brumale]